MSIWGPIATVAGGLLGGFMNNKAQEKTNRENQKFAHYMDATKIRRVAHDAKKAGIHPLAALGAASGGGGFGTAVAPTGMGDAVADGAAAIGSYISKSEQNKLAREVHALNKAEKLQNIATNKALADLYTAQSRTHIGKARLAGQSADTAGNVGKYALLPTKHKGYAPNEAEKYRLAGFDISSSPRSSDAGLLEERYGDGMGSLMGVIVTADDLLYNREQTWKKNRKKFPHGWR